MTIDPEKLARARAKALSSVVTLENINLLYPSGNFLPEDVRIILNALAASEAEVERWETKFKQDLMPQVADLQADVRKTEAELTALRAEVERLRTALGDIVRNAGGKRATNWHTYTDGYAAGWIQAGRIANDALQPQPKA